LNREKKGGTYSREKCTQDFKKKDSATLNAPEEKRLKKICKGVLNGIRGKRDRTDVEKSGKRSNTPGRKKRESLHHL